MCVPWSCLPELTRLQTLGIHGRLDGQRNCYAGLPCISLLTSLKALCFVPARTLCFSMTHAHEKERLRRVCVEGNDALSRLVTLTRLTSLVLPQLELNEKGEAALRCLPCAVQWEVWEGRERALL